MSSINLEVLVHPTRLRILQLFGRVDSMTTTEVARVLSDVPTSSLYRHLRALREAGLLSVVSTRQVRGASEKRYALPRPPVEGEPGTEGPVVADSVRQRVVMSLMPLLQWMFSPEAHSEVEERGVRHRDLQIEATAQEVQHLMENFEAMCRALANHPGAGHGEKTRVTMTAFALPGD